MSSASKEEKIEKEEKEENKESAEQAESKKQEEQEENKESAEEVESKNEDKQEENEENEEKKESVEEVESKNQDEEENKEEQIDEDKNEEEPQDDAPREEESDRKQEIKTGKKRKRNEPDKDKIENETRLFIEKLNQCVEEDKKSIEKKKPAIQKFKAVGQIQKFLRNKNYQEEFLNQGGLSILINWIKPNKEGTLPVINQLSIMLDILYNLNGINKDLIRESEIGAHIAELSKNPKVGREIMKKAKVLLLKWFRVIFGIDIDYRNLMKEENPNYKKIFYGKKGRDDLMGNDYEDENEEEESEEAENEGESGAEPGNSAEIEIYNQAKVPKKGLFAFTKAPVSMDIPKNHKKQLNFNLFFDKKKFKKK